MLEKTFTRAEERKSLHLALTDEEKAELERIARANERSLVGQVRYWIRQESLMLDTMGRSPID